MPSFVKQSGSTNEKSIFKSAIQMSCLVEITSHVFWTGRSIGRGQESADGKELVTKPTAMQGVLAPEPVAIALWLSWQPSGCCCLGIHQPLWDPLHTLEMELSARTQLSNSQLHVYSAEIRWVSSFSHCSYSNYSVMGYSSQWCFM